MAIPTTRFQNLSEINKIEFDTPITSISDVDPKQIINSGSNAVTSITKQIMSTVQKIASTLATAKTATNAQVAKNKLSQALGISKALGTINQVENSIRQIRGLMKSTMDSAGFSNSNKTNRSNNTSKLISSVFPNSSVQNDVKIIDSNQDGSISSNITTGKPFKPTVVGTGTSVIPGTTSSKVTGDPQYDYQQLVSVMQKLSGTANFTGQYVDNTGILRQMVSIGNAAYDANMTGVISALKNIPNATEEVVARATAIILTEQSMKGNSSAVIDISNSGVLGGTNSPLHASPAIIADTLSNFTLPVAGKQGKCDELITSLFQSLTNMDPNWDVSNYDNIPSTQYVETVSEDLVYALEVKATNHVFSESDLTVVFDSDDDLVISAMIATDPNMSNILRNLETSASCKNGTCNC